MSSTVMKSLPVVIRPAELEMTTSNIDLHSFDKGLGDMPATCFLVFDHPIDEPVETIKKGLSRALVYYSPIAGRLAAGAGNGELRVECNGEGVVFVAASTDRALNEAKFFDRSPGAMTLPDDLAVYYPDDKCGRTDPLLLMQVTVFSCGGFVVGVTWNHAIADGAGMAQFLQAVGELARGLPAPSVIPIRWDDSLPGIPPTIAIAQQSMTGLASQDFAFFDYTIPSSLISRIKAEFRDHANGQPCTVFEAVTAVLWQCRTRVAISDPEAPALLFIVANVRKHVGAKDGYYGNCVSGQLVMATSGSVANGDIMGIVKMIKGAKEQIPKRLKHNNIDSGGRERHGDMLRYNYNLLSVSSMRNIGLDEASFGGGRPVRVMCRARAPHMTVPSCVACLPWKGKDGANVLTRCVREEHVNAFLGELARFT
ncbi:acyl transferase 15-like [Phragmites australis]|uniref:acyl transferase 15-like n=1 Tax=Phragmites australis TaxID=29695 RepID=UPI002D768524|nr:acyl transferase 15-like [Phragmites australis]